MHRIFGWLIFLAFLITATVSVSASEGITQMSANDGSDARCFVTSTLMTDFDYKVIINCRDLRYPIDQNTFHYVAWADHGNNRNSRLGSLGVGKIETGTNDAFSRIFITRERSNQPRRPSDQIYMDGGVQAIAFLEGQGTEVETSEVLGTSDETNSNSPSIGVFGGANNQDTSSESVGGSGIGTAIRVLGGVAFTVIAIVLIVAFISASRSRRRPIS